jgi:DtxR family Mn-dependent transcriptional regulator
MTDLVDTTEMYLRTIIDLEEEGIPAFRARIAERIGHSGPTVSQTVARMERDGLVVVEADRRLALTKLGRDKAISVTRKHRLAERLLADVIGLDWSLVHEEACRWEHVMSEQVEKRLVAMLDSPTESPFGNPIPALDQIGGKKAEDFLKGVKRLTEVMSDDPREGLLRRIGEPAQFDPELLAQLQRHDIVPGNTITYNAVANGMVWLTTPGSPKGVMVTEEFASHLYVAA